MPLRPSRLRRPCFAAAALCAVLVSLLLAAPQRAGAEAALAEREPLSFWEALSRVRQSPEAEALRHQRQADAAMADAARAVASNPEVEALWLGQGVEVELSLPLDPTLTARARLSEALSEAVRLRSDLARTELSFTVALAWIETKVLDDRRAVAEARLALATALREQVDHRVAAGESTAADVVLARGAELVAWQEARNHTLAAEAAVSGLTLRLDLDAPPALGPWPEISRPEGAPERFVAVTHARAEAEAAAAQSRVADAARLPSMEAHVGATVAAVPEPRLGVTVELPLLSPRIAAATEQRSRADSLRLDAAVAEERAVSSWDIAVRRADHNDDSARRWAALAVDTLVEDAHRRFAGGEWSLAQVLAALDAHQDLRAHAIEARAAALRARLELWAHHGLLPDRDR